ncbi:MAG: helix-turn-helix transcriptional regulator [Leptolyngbyaceae cyanobacterium RU_5_1]|nr:helix-turn-helix transcriptional regulator [Leptolyngbyaceae cyanobacterium RU_5_1]
MTILVTSGNEGLAKERLAQLIKELRGQTTQREFAKLLGTSYTAVQDWEKQIRLPKGKNLERIAQLKGWTQEELIYHLFPPNPHSENAPPDPLANLIAHVQNLSVSQMQELSDYLNAQLNRVQNGKAKSMSCDLSDKQKHNLHLLLRASLRDQSPTEAMARVGVDPELFTDIFLRNNQDRTIDSESMEKLSRLCCRVIQWRAGQFPEVDCNQTYLGETALLLNVLAENDRVRIDPH